jgi:hypothetical protein
MGSFPEVLNVNRLLLKLNPFICNWQSVPPFIETHENKPWLDGWQAMIMSVKHL